MLTIPPASTDQSVYVHLSDSSDGTDETGFVAADLTVQYARDNGALTAVTETDLASTTAAHSDGGVIHVSGGNYRLDLPDSAFASGASVLRVYVSATGAVQTRGAETIRLDASVSSRADNSALTDIGDKVDTLHNTRLTDARAAKLDNLDATISSRHASGAAVASVSGNVGGNVVGSVGSVTSGVTVTTNNDKSGYSLTTAPPTAAAVAGQVRTELATELARIDATISSRSTFNGDLSAITDALATANAILEAQPYIGRAAAVIHTDEQANSYTLTLTEAP